ncbi:hypothetical protein K440DRAFT_656164 [Wilcoxina mikolae CBS 423.85]|nr:hypothetical protein K440DRAFT_656164 [Wilcoxina mikolae CBS 423.85]
MFAKSLLLAASLLALEASAFWRLPCPGRLTMARLDPIDTPGLPAHHAHAVHGGNGLTEGCSNDELRASDCTSCKVTEDKSGYWAPNLYWEKPDGTLQSLEQKGGMLVYYLLRGENVEPFPKDLRMIAGDGRLRNFTWDDSLTRTQYAGAGLSDNQHFLGQKAIGFNCLNYKESPEGALSVNKLPQDIYCPNGLRAELFFPSCWDGVNSDSENHRSHMAYPSVMDDGECPPTHPHRVPSLFYETIWDISPTFGNGGRLVFANGDPTGYGYHGDFMNGWSDKDYTWDGYKLTEVNNSNNAGTPIKKFLEWAIEVCTNMSGVLTDCPIFTANDGHYIQPDSDAEQCSKSNGHKVVGTDLPALPGCNTINEGPEYAAKGGCPGDHGHGNSTLEMPKSSPSPIPTPTPMPTYGKPTPGPAYGAPAKQPAQEPTYGQPPKESKPELGNPPAAPVSSDCPDENNPDVVVVTVTKTKTHNEKRAAETGIRAKRHVMQHLHKRHERKF